MRCGVSKYTLKNKGKGYYEIKYKTLKSKNKKCLHLKESLLYNPFVVTALGFRQMVRHWILIPAFWGSSPSSPAKSSHFARTFYLIENYNFDWVNLQAIKNVDTNRNGEMNDRIR